MRRWLITGWLGFLLGAAFSPWRLITESVVLWWWMIAMFSFMLIFYRRQNWLANVSWGLMCFLIGFGYWQWSHTKTDAISQNIGKYGEVRGVIVDELSNASSRKLIINTKSFDNQTTSGRILVPLKPNQIFLDFNYGDKLDIVGTLISPTNSGTFNYVAVLAKSKIFSIIEPTKLDVICRSCEGNSVLRFTNKIKNWLTLSITRGLTEPAASFLTGLLLGAKSTLPQNLLNDFQSTGLIHLVALSGFNITIIAAAMLAMLRWLPLRFRLVGATIGIIFFVMLTGASPSVVRAAIMGILMLAAVGFGRLYDIGVGLLLAATIMVAVNPQVLNYDLGFQLSFLATFGIIYVHPILQQYLKKLPAIITLYLSPTLSALILVTPWAVWHFGQVSLIAPIANLLVVPLVPLTMALGVPIALLGNLNNVVAVIFGSVVWLPLTIMLQITQFLARLPFASLKLSPTHWWWLVFYYSLIGLMIIYWYLRKSSVKHD